MMLRNAFKLAPVRFHTKSLWTSHDAREPDRDRSAEPALLAAARSTSLSGLTVIAALALALPAFAGERQDLNELTVTEFASGLTNPRHIRFGPDGNLYVAEAGVGGDLLPPNTSDCPAVNNYRTTPPLHGYMAGFTGRISRIRADGVRETVVDGLPSNRDGFESSNGPTDIAWLGHEMYVLVQAGGCSRGLPKHPAGIVRVRRDGTYEYVADISAFMRQNPVAFEPPCGAKGDCEPDGVPHTMIAYRGKLYVVETNHNSVLTVDPWTGDIKRIHDLSEHNPAPVSAVRWGPVFFLGDFNGPVQAFYSHYGRVHTLYESFGGIVDLAIIGHRLHVLETSSPQTPYGRPNDGRITRIDFDGTRKVIVDGLNMAVGMAKSPSGRDVFVTTNGYGQGTVEGRPAEGMGRIVRIALGRDCDPPALNGNAALQADDEGAD